MRNGGQGGDARLAAGAEGWRTRRDARPGCPVGPALRGGRRAGRGQVRAAVRGDLLAGLWSADVASGWASRDGRCGGRLGTADVRRRRRGWRLRGRMRPTSVGWRVFLGPAANASGAEGGPQR